MAVTHAPQAPCNPPDLMVLTHALSFLMQHSAPPGQLFTPMLVLCHDSCRTGVQISFCAPLLVSGVMLNLACTGFCKVTHRLCELLLIVSASLSSCLLWLLQELGQRALVAYLRSVFLQPNHAVFDVQKLPAAEYALSLGLPTAPKLRFLKNAGKQVKEVAMLPCSQPGIPVLTVCCAPPLLKRNRRHASAVMK